MSKKIVANRPLADALIKRGLMPNHCRMIDVQIAVDGAPIIRYEKFIDGDELREFAEALTEVAALVNAKDVQEPQS